MKNQKFLNWIVELFQVSYLNNLKNLLAKIAKETQSEIAAELSDPEMSVTLLNSVNPYLKCQKGRITAKVAKARYQIATENQTHQRLEHSAESRSSNTVITVLLDSESDGDLMFHEKGTTMHFPYLTRQVPTSWHTSKWELPH